MGQILKLTLIALPTFLIVDLLWLGVIAKDFYRRNLGDLMRETALVAPAAAFYVLFILGMVVFVIKPALATGELKTVLGLGAFFGLVTYATFDLTSYAVLNNFPRIVVVVDLIWGTVLSTTVSTVTWFVARALDGGAS